MPKFEVIERITINASPEQVRAVVRDFKQWSPWSPWLSAEPNCPLTYKDDGSGYAWDGEIIGSGMIDIASETDDSIFYELAFLKPWKSKSQVSFTFTPVNEGTEVSWCMQGSLPFFMFFMKNMMKAWVGSDYRRGLAKLKDYVELGKVPSKNEFKGLGEGVITHYVGIRSDASLDTFGEKMASQLESIQKFLEDRGIEREDALSIYHKFDLVKQQTVYTTAFAVNEIPNNLPSEFVSGSINAPKTYKIAHIGAYRHLGGAWSAGMMHQRGKKFSPKKGMDPFELYRNTPKDTPEDALITEVHFPAS